tara:strand:+ start:4759 stop:5880 length:1122 start_codon:yes stop_codon:yes gene_type:complete
MVKRKILLNPGPATTSESVKLAQVVPDICPREKEFGHLINRIRTDLLKIVHVELKTHTSILFGGSGTAAIESVINSVVKYNKKLLIIINGAYGLRMQQISELYNLNYDVISYEWGKSINFNEVENRIKSNPDIGYIAMVHHETTTGILNSIEKFSNIGTKYNVTMILDAMSSYAGVPINLKKTPIDYLVSTSNKCIQGMPGIGFVICNIDSLMCLKNIKPRSFYLDLYQQYCSLEKKGQFRFTPPVQVIYALNQAIIEYFKEGGENRYIRYTKSWERLTSGLIEFGFKLLDFKGSDSKILTTVYEPENVKFNFDEFHDYLFDRGFTVYPGKMTNNKTFRLSNMGEITAEDIDLFLSEMKKALIHLGIKLPLDK